MELEAALPERSRALDRRGQELADAERLISRRLTDLDQRTAQRADLSRRLEEARLGGQREGLEDRRTRAHERHRAALSVQELPPPAAPRRQGCLGQSGCGAFLGRLADYIAAVRRLAG